VSSREERLQELCTQAIEAKTSADVERISSEFRIALEEHISAARESLTAQASTIFLLDSVTGVREQAAPSSPGPGTPKVKS
jgi:hypothetical protein